MIRFIYHQREKSNWLLFSTSGSYSCFVLLLSSYIKFLCVYDIEATILISCHLQAVMDDDVNLSTYIMQGEHELK